MSSRWLWITPEISGELSTGALVYSMRLAQAVAGLGVELTMVGTGHDTAEAFGDPDGGIDRRTVPRAGRAAWRSVVSPLPNQAHAKASAEFRAEVRALLDACGWDVVVVDGMQVAWVAPLLIGSPATTVFVTHNHESSMRREVAAATPWTSVKRLVLGADAWKTARLERQMLELADVVTSITEEDRRKFEAQAPAARHVVVQPAWSGVEPTTVPAIADRPRRVGMLGSYEWHVKQENLRRFLDAAAPVFAQHEIELVIGGKMPAEIRHEFERAHPGVSFEGWVADPAAFLGTCRVGVVSEPLGGGFKLKILDYVFLRVPLACLVGCSVGLPLVGGEHMIEADDERSLADAIVRAIDQPELLRGLAQRAYDDVSASVSWPNAAQRILDAVAAR